MKIFFLILFFLIGTKAWAYPSMIRHGYTSCVGCHYAPQGGGLLTIYGKSIAKAFAMPGGDYKESELKKTISMNGVWEQALQFRLAHLKKETETVTFPMQGDFLAGFKVADKGFANITLAKLPERGKTQTTKQESGFFTDYLVRSLGYVHQLSPNYLLQLERGRLPLGLNIEDHSTFIKRRNKNDTTDLVSRIALQYLDKTSLAEIDLFAPSGQEKEGNEELGGMIKYEWFVLKKISLGGQLLYAKTELIKRDLQGFYSRGAIFDDLIWLVEINRTHREIEGLAKGPNQWTSYLKLSYFLKDWLEFYVSKEKLELDRSFKSESKTDALGLRFAVLTNLSLQVDHKITETNNIDNKLTMLQAYLNWW